MFHRLLRARHFPSQWCCADVVPIPKDTMTFTVRVLEISITIVLSKVYERLVSSRLFVFMESEILFFLASVCLSYHKGVGTCVAMLDMVCTGHVALCRER